MTTVELRDHAAMVLASNEASNSGYIANGELTRHAVTAKYLLDLCEKVDALETRVSVLEADAHRSTEWGESLRNVRTAVARPLGAVLAQAVNNDHEADGA